MTLTDLEARLAEATGADREIDAAIWLACFEPNCRHFAVTFHTEQYDNFLSRTALECDLGTVWVDDLDPPLLRYTESIDAASALLRRVRPKVRMRVEAMPNGSGVASVYDGDDRDGPAANASTPALALCLALVRALRSMRQQGEGE